jgi:hypothetical protein
MITSLYKKTLLVIIPLAALSAFIEPKRLPVGIFLGGVLALVNLKGLSRGLEGMLGSYRPTMRLLFMSLFRLFLLAAALAALIMTRVASVIGLMVGFTVVFVLLVAEGLRVSKEGQ